MIVAEISQQKFETHGRLRQLAKWGPAIIALLTFWGTVRYIYEYTTARTGGTFTYGLDDAYIHLAIARNIAEHAVWGVTRYGFTSATSSPLWTILVALLYRLHPSTTISLYLNTLLGSILILQASIILQRYRFGFAFNTLSLLLLEFAIPLPRLALMGMEHMLQIVAVISFIDTFSIVYAVQNPSRIQRSYFNALCFILPVIRYELLLMLVVAGVLLQVKGRGNIGLRGLLSALLMIAVFGAYSTANGAYFVPNSVLLKTAFSAVPTSGGSLWQQLEWQMLVRLAWLPFLFALLASTTSILCTRRFGWPQRSAGQYDREHSVLWLFLIVCSCQLIVPGDPYSIRYEAYLVAIGLIWPVAISWRYALDELAPKDHSIRDRAIINPRTIVALAAGTVILLGFRGYDSYHSAKIASVNIYDQQREMAKFVKMYCSGRAVALNDIGCVCYFDDVHCLDLVGLADRNVARARITGTYRTDTIQRLATQMSVSVAMVYDGWFNGKRGHFPKMPSSWQKVGTLTIENNVTCAEPDVSIYATSPTEAKEISKNLRAFATTVPPGVHITVRQ